MFKKILVSCALVFSLFGCASNQSSVSVSEQTEAEIEAEQLISTLEMDNMARVKNRVVLGMIFGGDQTVVNDSCMYRSSEEGNYDMVGVFFTDDMEKCKEYIDEYLATIKEEGNINYPQEVFKISNAVEKNNEQELILIICENIESAKEEALQIVGETE